MLIATPQAHQPYEAEQQIICSIIDDAAYTRYSSWVDLENADAIHVGKLCVWALKNQPKIPVKNKTEYFISVEQDLVQSENEELARSELREGLIRDAIISEIRELGNLPEDWDGYGAIRVLPDCLSNAIQVMSMLNCESVESVDANPNGTVSVLWTNEDGEEIGLEVGTNEMSYYADVQGEEIYRSHIDFNKENITELASLAAAI